MCFKENTSDPTKCDDDDRNALHYACLRDLEERENIEELVSLLLTKYNLLCSLLLCYNIIANILLVKWLQRKDQC